MVFILKPDFLHEGFGPVSQLGVSLRVFGWLPVEAGVFLGFAGLPDSRPRP